MYLFGMIPKEFQNGKILFHFLLKNMPSTYLYVLTKKGKLKTQEH